MSFTFTESIVEEAALNWFGEMDYSVEQGPKLAPGELAITDSSNVGERNTAFKS